MIDCPWITFNFAALNNFLDLTHNQYTYRLEGLHDEWISNGNSTAATFTNLDPGEYTFEVKAANNSGVWSSQVASLSLIVTPPWYATWWSYILYLALASALLYLFSEGFACSVCGSRLKWKGEYRKRV
ncbi:MAG: triple tyrosine motif-containing protein [Owenweeksia sp.]|nr:triple tyrosine motif-containing protein [Owenweeksia sp.]